MDPMTLIQDAVCTFGVAPVARALGVPRSTLTSVLASTARAGSTSLVAERARERLDVSYPFRQRCANELLEAGEEEMARILQEGTPPRGFERAEKLILSAALDAPNRHMKSPRKKA
jgi:hypothetical protein